MIQKKRAERFNNYFNSVFKIDNGEPSHEDCLFSDFDGDALSNISISPADVKETLEQVKVGKSCGPDMISPRLLKECVNSISSPLCTLFKTNHLVVVSCFPKLWKVTNLVSVFKPDDKEIVDNYRAISLLSVVSRVLEKCIFSRVFIFFQPKLYHVMDGL